MRLSNAIAAGALLSALATPAAAGASDGNWTGVYIGGSVGGGWGNVDTNVNCLGDDCAGAIAEGAFSTHFSSNLDGGLGGGQIGYNFQASESLVLGVEADISGTSISGGDSQQTNGGAVHPAEFAEVSEDLKYFGTVRGRIGYAARNWLVYATGGLAFAQVDYGYSVSEPDTSSTGLASASEHKLGWTLGSGPRGRADDRRDGVRRLRGFMLSVKHAAKGRVLPVCSRSL